MRNFVNVFKHLVCRQADNTNLFQFSKSRGWINNINNKRVANFLTTQFVCRATVACGLPAVPNTNSHEIDFCKNVEKLGLHNEAIKHIQHDCLFQHICVCST